jgi:hypothetical protein
VLWPWFELGLETATRKEVGQIEKAVREYLVERQRLAITAIRDKNARRKRKTLLAEPVQIAFQSVTKEDMRRSARVGGHADYPQAALIARFLEICEGIGRQADALSESQVAERQELLPMLPALVDVPDGLEHRVKKIQKKRK